MGNFWQRTKVFLENPGLLRRSFAVSWAFHSSSRLIAIKKIDIKFLDTLFHSQFTIYPKFLDPLEQHIQDFCTVLFINNY